MKDQYLSSAIDIGNSKIRVVSTKLDEGSDQLKIVGFSEVPCFGMRKGIVVDTNEVINSIAKAIDANQRVIGEPIESVWASIDGAHFESQNSKGVIAVSRADNEISEDDLLRVEEAAQAISLPNSREIIHVTPRSYIVDGQEGIKDPVGMVGIRLEAETNIITAATPIVKNLARCIEQAGVDVEGFVASPLASSLTVLSQRQKELGTVVIDIGSATTGIAVYVEGEIFYLNVLPIGSTHITNDIAIALRTSVDTAEKIKLEYGFAVASEIDKKEKIPLGQLEPQNTEVEEEIPKKDVAKVIEARVREIFGLIQKELRKIGHAGQLPAGAVLTGGGSKLPGIVDIAKDELGLPAQVGFPLELKGVIDKLDDPTAATVIGLLIYGVKNLGGDHKDLGERMKGSKGIKEKVKGWFKAFLP
jgi:cell division protein FtsA